MNRGDVWTINLGGRVGTPPVFILTRQNVLEYLNKVRNCCYKLSPALYGEKKHQNGGQKKAFCFAK